MDKKRLLPSLSALSFNKDASQVAICHGTPEITIFYTNYSTNTDEWIQTQVLKGTFLDQRYLDWNHSNNMLLSASTDTTAIVWRQNKNHEFIPELIELFDFYALSIQGVKWAKNGRKFVVNMAP